MISNERKWPSQARSYHPQFQDAPTFAAPRPTLREDMLKAGEIQIERKNFLVMLKENQRGRFMRIAEETQRGQNSIMIPADGIHDFQKMLAEMVQAAAEIPAANSGAKPAQTLPPPPQPLA